MFIFHSGVDDTRTNLKNTVELKLGISLTGRRDYFGVSKWISASCWGSSWEHRECFDIE